MKLTMEKEDRRKREAIGGGWWGRKAKAKARSSKLATPSSAKL
jgi:hypothetical protein